MITIHYDARGHLVAPLVQDGTSVDGPVTGLLPGATGQLTFDEATNPGALAGLGADWGAHTVVAGALQRGGVAVALAPDSASASERADMLASGQQALDSLTTYLGLASPTAAQTTQVVKLLCRIARYLLRRALAS